MNLFLEFQSCFPDEEDSSFNQEFTLYDTGYLIARSKDNTWDWCVIEKDIDYLGTDGEIKTKRMLIGDECQSMNTNVL